MQQTTHDGDDSDQDAILARVQHASATTRDNLKLKLNFKFWGAETST
jgi:hypothetical protein